MSKDCLGQRIAGLALVEAHMAAPPQVWAFEPVEREQAPLDPSNLLEGEIHPVLALVSTQLLQHHGGSNSASFEGGCQMQHLVPALTHHISPDRAAHQRLEATWHL